MMSHLPFAVIAPDGAAALPSSSALLAVYALKPASTHWTLPLFSSKVAAGFPSPADDYIEGALDLNTLLVKRPAATFFVRVQGDSMLGAGIHPDDILVVDRSLPPRAGKVVICAINGELTVKRLLQHDGVWCLHAENPAYPDTVLSDALDAVCWGVVTNVIHAL